MTGEEELRVRYQTSRFREAARLMAPPIESDITSTEPSRSPIVDTTGPDISGGGEVRDSVVDQYSDGDTENSRADTGPIRGDAQTGGLSDTTDTDARNLRRVGTSNEELDTLKYLEAPTPALMVTSESSFSGNQEELQSQRVAYDNSGSGSPTSISPESPDAPGVSTLPQDRSGNDLLVQSTLVDMEVPGTRDIEDDIGRSVVGEHNDNCQVDGAICSARRRGHMRSSDSDSDQERQLISQPDGNNILAEEEVAASGEAAVTPVALPRWQPDAEVTYCPICRTQFNFFVRKHHCRKCGRVVCASCSPHRITIPFQFIVQPPVAGPATTLPVAQLVGHDTDDVSNFGGAKVRLCNPCVPDPNITPPQPQRTAADERWRDAPPTYYLSSSNRPYSFGEEDMENLERQTSGASVRSRAVSSSSAAHRQHQLSMSPYPPRSSSQAAYLGGTSYTGPHNLNQGPSSYQRRYPNRSPRAPRHQSHQSLSISSSGSPSNAQPHYRSLLDPFASQQPQSSFPGVDTSRPLPPIPRIREEDECPVCHRELPSRSLPDFETLRTNHINDCIEEQIAIHSGRQRRQSPANTPVRYLRPPEATTTSSASATPQVHSHSPNSTASPSSSQDIVSLVQAINLQPAGLAISSFPNTPEGRTAYREAQHAAVVFGHTHSASQSPHAHPSSPFSPEPRRTGMFPYKATEKDCVDDAECTICLEEFEVGLPMARLECLCRFHEKCIRSWWETKPGRCPMHGHDAWGL